MRIFHELVYDGFVAGFKYLPVQTWEPLGSVDMVCVSGYTTQVSGTSPTLSLTFERSADGFYWGGETTLVNIPLSTSQETMFQGQSNDPALTVGAGPVRRLQISIGGTNAVGLVRLWVTGRDTSPRAKNLSFKTLL